MVRLFVADALAGGSQIDATPNQAHYLATVMRRAEGEQVILFNGRDGEWVALLSGLKRDRARFLVQAQTRAQAAEPDLWLLFAPLKRDATDLVVQKATELGVSALVPVITARTNAARVNVGRLTAIAIEAAEQSERLTVPEIRMPAPLADILAAWPPGRRLAAALERAGPSPIPSPAGGLLVGPEGGFAPQELDALRRASFMAPISLGPRVLRAETAAIAGLALLLGAGWSTT
jgi:16S rRNA (uracil1498-N3)-methyltransferase